MKKCLNSVLNFSDLQKIVFLSFAMIVISPLSVNAANKCTDILSGSEMDQNNSGSDFDQFVSATKNGVSFQVYADQFNRLPLQDKISRLDSIESNLEKFSNFISYSGVSVLEVNETKLILRSGHGSLSKELSNDIVDVESFELVIGYLQKTRPTLFKYDFPSSNFSLVKALEKGSQYLQQESPGFDEGLRMLKTLSIVNKDICSYVMEDYLLFSSGVEQIYIYTITHATKREQAEEIKKYFVSVAKRSPSTGSLVFPGARSVLADIVSRTKNILLDGPR